jgi:ribonuclease HI
MLTGADKRTTNNRMELRAVIEGLRALNEPCRIEVITDAQYVQRGMLEHMPRWKTNGWQTANHEPVANRELWEELDSLASDHKIQWTWVRGHGPDPDQQRCDAAALEAAQHAS